VDAAPGDVARIPADAEHWHGAHPDEAQAMTHLSAERYPVSRLSMEVTQCRSAHSATACWKSRPSVSAAWA
jgi:quercetin dioxygenase-like cupin family protein